MSNSIAAQIEARLFRVYPRAISYIELFDHALNGTPASAVLNKRGGSYMTQLVKAGKAKQLTRGIYIAIPQ